MADNKYSAGSQVTVIPATPSGERPAVRGFPLDPYGVPLGIARASHHHCDSRIPRGSHRPRSSSRPRPATPCSIWLTRSWDTCSARRGSSKGSSITAPAPLPRSAEHPSTACQVPPLAGLGATTPTRATPPALCEISHDPGHAPEKSRKAIVAVHFCRELFITLSTSAVNCASPMEPALGYNKHACCRQTAKLFYSRWAVCQQQGHGRFVKQTITMLPIVGKSVDLGGGEYGYHHRQ